MTPDDIDLMADLLGDPEVMQFYPAPKNRDEAATWIEWNLENYERLGYGLWIIESLDGDFLGECGLTWQAVNGVSKLEVGYHVVTARQGQGLATEAAAACRDLARGSIDTHELVAIIHPENWASKRVAEKIGMHRVEDDYGGSIPVRHVLSMSLDD